MRRLVSLIDTETVWQIEVINRIRNDKFLLATGFSMTKQFRMTRQNPPGWPGWVLSGYIDEKTILPSSKTLKIIDDQGGGFIDDKKIQKLPKLLE